MEAGTKQVPAHAGKAVDPSVLLDDGAPPDVPSEEQRLQTLREEKLTAMLTQEVSHFTLGQ